MYVNGMTNDWCNFKKLSLWHKISWALKDLDRWGVVGQGRDMIVEINGDEET